MFGDNILIP